MNEETLSAARMNAAFPPPVYPDDALCPVARHNDRDDECKNCGNPYLRQDVPPQGAGSPPPAGKSGSAPIDTAAVYDKYLPLRILSLLLYLAITVYLVLFLITGKPAATEPSTDSEKRAQLILDLFLATTYLLFGVFAYIFPTGLAAVGLIASLQQNKRLGTDKVPVFFIVMTALPFPTMALLPSIVKAVMSLFG